MQARTGQFRESTKHFFVKDTKHPYEETKPFTWIQGDQVGGKSLIWGRQVYRWSDLDFEANARDGHRRRLADPLQGHRALVQLRRAARRRERREARACRSCPTASSCRRWQMNAGEKLVKAGIERRFTERRMTIGRVAILTGESQRPRAPATTAGRASAAAPPAPTSPRSRATLPPAMATGTPHRAARQHRPLARLRREDASRVGRARAWTRRRRRRASTSAKVVFLCASTLGSTRILLNSKSSTFPNGIAQLERRASATT